jgi:aminoglycoside 6'-N-acetyltransferase I
MRPLNVRLMDPEQDLEEWLRMRFLLWPDGTRADYLADLRTMAQDDGWAIFVCQRPAGGLCGFLELSTRVDYVEGCDTSPVAYIEGWYVDEDVRQQGLGGMLCAAGESWAARRGLTEIGSDTWLDNPTSITAHERLGYAIVGKSVHFRKVLRDVL